MKSKYERLRLKLSVATVLLALAAPSHAYVDPGTGAMFVQMAAAAIAGAIFYFRSALTRVMSWFVGDKQPRPGKRDQ